GLRRAGRPARPCRPLRTGDLRQRACPDRPHLPHPPGRGRRRRYRCRRRRGPGAVRRLADGVGLHRRTPAAVAVTVLHTTTARGVDVPPGPWPTLPCSPSGAAMSVSRRTLLLAGGTAATLLPLGGILPAAQAAPSAAGATPAATPVPDPIPVTGTWTRTSDGGQKATAGRRGPALALSDRKSTRLNSSHVKISYAVFCLKKKNI